MSIKFNNLFLISILFHLLIAVSAPPFIFELDQSDGQKIPVKLFGHEYYNWMETQDGYVVDWGDDGEFRGLYYSVLDNDGKFINSEIFVTYPAPIDIDIAKHLRERNPQVRDLSYKKLHSKKFHKHLNIIKLINQMNVGSTCSICFQDNVDSYFNPCGHTACSKCMSKTGEFYDDDHRPCPLCRKQVMSIHKLFFA